MESRARSRKRYGHAVFGRAVVFLGVQTRQLARQLGQTIARLGCLGLLLFVRLERLQYQNFFEAT